MGLYYKAIVSDEFGNNRSVYAPYVKYPNGEERFMGYKMEEHMDVSNLFMNSFSHLLKNSPTRVIWSVDADFTLGDADEETGAHFLVGKRTYKGSPVALPTYEEAWGKNKDSKPVLMNSADMEYESVYLVDYDKKIYLDMYKYLDKHWRVLDRGWYKETYCPSPVPLLTNQDKPCDYENIANKEVCFGAWAWDLISYSSTIPKGFKEVEF